MCFSTIKTTFLRICGAKQKKEKKKRKEEGEGGGDSERRTRTPDTGVNVRKNGILR